MSQNTQILNYLKRGRAITPLEALRMFGCFRLGARIWDLRKNGHRIERDWVEQGSKHWAKYRLVRSS